MCSLDSVGVLVHSLLDVPNVTLDEPDDETDLDCSFDFDFRVSENDVDDENVFVTGWVAEYFVMLGDGEREGLGEARVSVSGSVMESESVLLRAAAEIESVNVAVIDRAAGVIERDAVRVSSRDGVKDVL